MIKNHEILLSYHHDVRNTGQAMSTINFLDLVEKIKSGENNLDHQIKLLRKVQSYSKERYRTMKTQLPYFSMSIFADGKRHYDHFISANGLIIDIDAETHLDPSLLQKIKSDERIKLLFTSPNGYGLKIVICFTQPMRDKQSYTQMYKTFVQEFAVKYALLDKIDLRNSDVSRICFLSHDPLCFYNPEAAMIDIQDYLPQKTIQLIPPQDKDRESMSPDVYRQIMQKLGSKPRPAKPRPFVPEEVIKILPALRDSLRDHGIEMHDTEEINYGMKIFTSIDLEKGEVIIYYGKDGYKVVTSPKKGTSEALNEVSKRIIWHYLTESTKTNLDFLTDDSTLF